MLWLRSKLSYHGDLIGIRSNRALPARSTEARHEADRAVPLCHSLSVRLAKRLKRLRRLWWRRSIPQKIDQALLFTFLGKDQVQTFHILIILLLILIIQSINCGGICILSMRLLSLDIGRRSSGTAIIC